MTPLVAVGEFQSFIRTGGEWIEGRCGEWKTGDDGQPVRLPDTDGHYVGGAREAGRFTSKLAPASSCPLATSLARDRETVSIPAAPRYDTPSEVTKRAQERGTGTYLPIKGEELGVKFVKDDLAPILFPEVA